ncbi:hypothetical protein FKW77_003127 [Venturia effusa]|uniref:Uncharacterized protein n=1 Tax=Venturia effusa TaxID=50376 RepID=A0A517LJZ0_9PEZI|nr:hypothetical protein FKW77_003127 [Venturia effusa]
MNGHIDAAQRPSLRGGDGSINAMFLQQQQPPPNMGPLVQTLNAYGSLCVPFNAHANTAVVDLPRHSPEEMNLLVEQVDIIAEQEKQFPTLLHKHRTNIDKVTTETSTNYTELMNLIRAEMEKTNDTTTVEMLSLLQGEFYSLIMLATNSEAMMSKNFDDYKNMLYDQFGKVMTLERANLHNALAVWRDHFQHDQQKALNQQVKISQDVANSKGDLIANLQQQVSKLSMRLGLVLAEKKGMEGKIREHEKAAAKIKGANEQAVTDREHAKQTNAQGDRSIQKLQQRVHELDLKVRDLNDAHTQLQEKHEHCPDSAEVDLVFEELDKTVGELCTMKEEKDEIAEKHQALQVEHQFCAEYAEKVKNLPDIWELRTEVVHLKQEIARLSKKNAELKSERVADTKVADDFAGLAIENGLTPGDVRSRLQSQKLQSQLATSTARNNELGDQIKTLEAKNATLEDTVKVMQATISDRSSAYLVSEPQNQSEAMSQELSDAQELIELLDDKNADLEKELSERRSDPLEARVKRLQGQLELYKNLLTKDRSGPREILNLLSGTQMQKLVKSGLHRHNPTRAFVSETYFIYSELVKDRMERKVREDAKKPTSNFAFDVAAEHGKPYKPAAGEPDADGIIWDVDSDDGRWN